MEELLPLEKRIAIIYDYDLTLTEEYQQVPLFLAFWDQIRKAYHGKHYGGSKKKLSINTPGDYFTQIVDSWGEPNNGLCYLEQMLMDSRRGILPPLTKKLLAKYGRQVETSNGLPAFFSLLKEQWAGKASIANYIISVGIQEMIEANKITKPVDGIFASDFARFKDGEQAVRRNVSPFSKTREAIKIAKGSSDKIDEMVQIGDYTFDYRNIICIGDGQSDVSQFAYLKKKGATIICVYKADSWEQLNKAANNKELRERVDWLIPRDYSVGLPLWTTINRIIRKKLARKCKYPQILVDQFRKGKIEDPDLYRTIARHVEKCDYCEGEFNFRWLPPLRY